MSVKKKLALFQLQITKNIMQNIILTGFSGTGKTEVAKQLAKNMNWIVIDTDTIIEKQEGKRIKEIFEKEGEENFRAIETKILALKARQEDTAFRAGKKIKDEQADQDKKDEEELERKNDQLKKQAQQKAYDVAGQTIDGIFDLKSQHF